MQAPETLEITTVAVLLPKEWVVSGEMKIQILLWVKKAKFMLKKKSGSKPFSPDICRDRIIEALLKSHPYEEVAYDIYPLENKFDKIGMGMIGTLTRTNNRNRISETIKNNI